MSKNKTRIFLVLLLCALLPIAAVVSASFQGAGTASAVSRTTASFNEPFTTTDYQDGGATTAAGWGTGVVNSPQTSQPALLDYYAISDPVTAIEVQGRKVYAAVSLASAMNSLRIFDITDPTNIVARGTRNSGNLFMAVGVEGDLGFVGESENGGSWMGVYNVSNPDSIPVPLDGYTFPDGSVTDFDVQGHFLYVTVYQCTGEEFSIFDIEDPSNIYKTSSIDYTYMLGIDVVGQLAYIADGFAGFYVRNVSNPYSTTHVDYVNTSGNSTDVLVDGSLAYVADGSSGVQIVDVSDPNSLSIIGSCNTPGNAEELALQGDTLFVADRSGGVRLIDVSDPTDPQNITSITGLEAYSVGLYGSVLVVGAEDGIYTYQYGSFTDLSVVGTFDDYEVWDVRVRGDIAYVAAGPDGFLTVNVSDPTNPVLLDRYVTGVKMCKLDIQGHHAYVIDYAVLTAFYIFDISDPTDIKLVPTGMLAGGLIDVFAWGEVIFYTFEGGWGAMNASDPTSLTIIHNTFFGTNITACWVQGYHVYLVENLGGLGPGFHVIDSLNIASPSVISSESLSSYHYDVYVDGDVGFAANNQSATVWNVTDPYNPDDTDSTSSSNPAVGVWGFGPYMISLRRGTGVEIYDTSNINDIRIISSCSGMEGALQVTAHGDYIYVANRSSLEVLRFFDSRSFYIGLSTAQSITVDDTLELITNATLSTVTQNPYGTGISYYLSADGGLHWESVTLGVSHTFTYPGSDLRFQTNLTTSRLDRSAHLFDVTISYSHFPLPAPPILLWLAIIIVVIVIILVILLLYFLWYKKKEK